MLFLLAIAGHPLSNNRSSIGMFGYNKKGVNTGVFASKYNFGINNLRCETAAVSIATSSKRKSA